MPIDETELDLVEVLEAEESASIQVLTLYIPNKDKDGNPVETQDDWVHGAAELLARIGGGVTILPPCRGGWLNPESGEIVWEEPVKLYTYVKADAFAAHIGELRSFLHRLGVETMQGEVALEFDGVFLRITNYDAESEV